MCVVCCVCVCAMQIDTGGGMTNVWFLLLHNHHPLSSLQLFVELQHSERTSYSCFRLSMLPIISSSFPVWWLLFSHGAKNVRGGNASGSITAHQQSVMEAAGGVCNRASIEASLSMPDTLPEGQKVRIQRNAPALGRQRNTKSILRRVPLLPLLQRPPP